METKFKYPSVSSVVTVNFEYRLSDLTVKDFLPQETADLVSFTGEILNGKTKFLD